MVGNRMQLSTIRKGMRVRIEQLPEGEMRSQFIRIGLMEGVTVSCLEKLPGGTIVLGLNHQEVALSDELASAILISRL